MSFYQNSSKVQRSALRSILLLGVVTLLVFGAGSRAAVGQVLNESFDNINTIEPAGWFIQNNSVPLGPVDWFQGNLSPTTGFPQFSGTGYIAVNYASTDDAGVGDINDWLLTPNRTFHNGDTLRFYTRTAGTAQFADRLEVRMSATGTSTNVGTTTTDVGDFTTLLLSINPNLQTGSANYPIVWTPFTITFSGLPPAGVSGRVAFRYFVPNGGFTGANSNYIGIDQFSYLPAATAAGVTLSGRVIGAEERGLSAAFVTLTDARGNVRKTVTGPHGLFSFDDVESGGDYVISIRSRLYEYSSVAVHVTDSLSDLLFRPSNWTGPKSVR